MDTILSVGLGVGLLGALGGLVNAYPTIHWLNWAQFWVGIVIFLGCLIGKLIQSKKTPIKLFKDFLNLKIKQGEKFLKTYQPSFSIQQIEGFNKKYREWYKQVFLVYLEVVSEKHRYRFDFPEYPHAQDKHLPSINLEVDIKTIKAMKEWIKESYCEMQIHNSVFKENEEFTF